MSKEGFKLFVKTKPDLINYVRSKEMSWQDFYDIYELYGDDSNIWDKYKSSSGSIKSLLDSIKQMDMNEVQKGINSLQKGIGYIKDIIKDKEIPVRNDSYEPRKIYEHFDD